MWRRVIDHTPIYGSSTIKSSLTEISHTRSFSCGINKQLECWKGTHPFTYTNTSSSSSDNGQKRYFTTRKQESTYNSFNTLKFPLNQETKILYDFISSIWSDTFGKKKNIGLVSPLLLFDTTQIKGESIHKDMEYPLCFDMAQIKGTEPTISWYPHEWTYSLNNGHREILIRERSWWYSSIAPESFYTDATQIKNASDNYAAHELLSINHSYSQGTIKTIGSKQTNIGPMFGQLRWYHTNTPNPLQNLSNSIYRSPFYINRRFISRSHTRYNTDDKESKNVGMIFSRVFKGFVLGSFFCVFIIGPSILYWLHLYVDVYGISDEDLDAEKKESRRLERFFELSEDMGEEEFARLWKPKDKALQDFGIKIMKSAHLARALGDLDVGVDMRYVLPPSSSNYEIDDIKLRNQSPWCPRLIFTSDEGAVLCYLTVVRNEDDWIPTEAQFVDCSLSERSGEDAWVMKGQLPHGIMYQRMPPKPKN